MNCCHLHKSLVHFFLEYPVCLTCCSYVSHKTTDCSLRSLREYKRIIQDQEKQLYRIGSVCPLAYSLRGLHFEFQKIIHNQIHSCVNEQDNVEYINKLCISIMYCVSGISLLESVIENNYTSCAEINKVVLTVIYAKTSFALGFAYTQKNRENISFLKRKIREEEFFFSEYEEPHRMLEEQPELSLLQQQEKIHALFQEAVTNYRPFSWKCFFSCCSTSSKVFIASDSSRSLCCPQHADTWSQV